MKRFPWWLIKLCCLLEALLFFASSAHALDAVTLQLKWTHAFQFAGYYAAKEKGYYREAGLDVRIDEALPGIDPVKNVVEGKAEFGVGTSALLLERKAGKPVVVLAVIFQHSPYVLIARQYYSSQTIHDLIDKRIMLEPEADEIMAYLKREGIPLNRIKQLQHTYDPQDLIDGKTDAIAAYVTNQPYYLDRAHFAYQTYTPRSAGIDFYGDNLFTTEAELRAHPERVKAFRAASLRGWQYAMNNPEEIIDLILAKYSKRHTRDYYRFEVEQMIPLLRPELIEIGYMYPGRWRHMAETYAEIGMLPRDFSLNGFLYDPNPSLDLTWFYRILATVLLLSGMVGAVAVYIGRNNRRLKRALSERMQAEEELSRSEDNFRRSMDDSPLGKRIVTNEGETIYANRAFLELYGYDSIEKFQTAPTEKRYTPESYAEFLIRREKRRQGIEAPSEYEIDIVRENGEVRHLQVIRRELLWDGVWQHQIIYQDITARGREEKLVKSRLRLIAAAQAKSSRELMQMVLDEIETLTGSVIGFYHLLLEDQETLALQTWSTNTLRNMCTAEGEGSHYPISQAGVWVDCVRERRPVIHNDYNSLPHRKGMPPGHAPVMREIVVPIFRGERIVAIIGVGNKPAEYNAVDIDTLSQLGDFSWEIIERNRVQEALRNSETQLRAVLDATPFPVALVDLQDNKIYFWSRSAHALFGHTATTTPEWYQIAYPDPDYQHEVIEQWKVALEEARQSSHAVNTGEYRVTCRDGSVRICEIYAAFLADRLIVTFNDITERKQAEEKVKASLREKETLLKEIHHRVKNNLQIIASLINMQSRQVGDEKLEGMFRECQDRIMAMASIHTLLYRSQNFAEIDFGEYIHETAGQLLRSYQKSSALISLIINASHVSLPIDKAIPCGLIINELMTNAVKYAFPGDRQGEIKIEMGNTENGIRLLFADNGIGFPHDITFRDTKTMGLKLVNLLVEQLEGTIEQVINGGTGFLIMFKLQSVSEEVPHVQS